MSLPAQIAVSFDFSSGATFGTGFVIGSPDNGVIGVNSFGSSDVIIPTVDLTPDVYSISIRRGRNIMKDQYEAGTAIVRVLDPLGYFNPQNPASPYFGYLVPLRKLRVSATTATADHFLFSGYVNDYKYYFPVGQETAYVDILCTDGFRLLQMSQIQTVADSGAGQTTGTRLNKILDDVQFPNSMRQISTGDATCLADPATVRITLDAIKNVEFSEGLGAFYMSPDGSAVFKSRSEVTATLGEPAIEFNQTTGISYKSLKYQFDDKLIINDVKFNRIGGTSQNVFSQDSIDKYFPHALTQENLVAETDAQVLGAAQNYVNTRKETTIRIDEMTVDLLDPAVPTDTMIGLDYFDNLTITNVTQEGSTIVKTLQAQGFAWDITPNKMSVTVTTLEPILDGFIIGSSTYGKIGESTLSYWSNMATFPVTTGDVLTAGVYNSLPTFTIGSAQTADYTAVAADQYQALQLMNKATAIAFKIPTNASVAFPIGTAITVLNIGVGTCTISAVTSGTTTILSAGATAAAPTLAQYKSAVCIKTATDTWHVVGAVA